MYQTTSLMFELGESIHARCIERSEQAHMELTRGINEAIDGFARVRSRRRPMDGGWCSPVNAAKEIRKFLPHVVFPYDGLTRVQDDRQSPWENSKLTHPRLE